MTSDTDKNGACDQENLSDAAQINNEAGEKQTSEEYQPWDDGFRVSMLLLLVMGLPLFLASLYFVLYAIFAR
ncbi:MAG: hypothetical protein ABIQ54_05060 [Gammaproteobacteria bacterium]